MEDDEDASVGEVEDEDEEEAISVDPVEGGSADPVEALWTDVTNPVVSLDRDGLEACEVPDVADMADEISVREPSVSVAVAIAVSGAEAPELVAGSVGHALCGPNCRIK